MNSKMREKFWPRVNKESGLGPNGDCWEWVKARSGKGYGRFHLSGGKYLPAHRVSFLLTHGAIPDGMLICHHCDNPPCVNPEHLFAGTNSDNTKDAVRKGRVKVPEGRRFKPGHSIRSNSKGQPSLYAKMDESMVRSLRERYRNGERLFVLAREVPNVHKSCVNRMITGKTYRHII